MEAEHRPGGPPARPGPAPARPGAPRGPRPARSQHPRRRLRGRWRAARPAADRAARRRRPWHVAGPVSSRASTTAPVRAASTRGRSSSRSTAFAPYREGSPGVADPLADRRADRRADRAPPGRRRRHGAAGRPRRVPAGEPGGTRPRRSRRGLALRHLPQAGGCALLLPGERRPAEIEPELRGWPGAHARLALVEPSSAGPALAPLQRAGAVFWITARAKAALPPALRHGSGARYLVGPSVHGAGAPAFLVAGCEGRRIGARAAGGHRRAA